MVDGGLLGGSTDSPSALNLEGKEGDHDVGPTSYSSASIVEIVIARSSFVLWSSVRRGC